MSIKALYVYSATEFTTNTQIYSITGSQHGPGPVTLAPRIYRFAENASLVAQNGALGADFELQGGTKGDWPDPPVRAVEELSFSAGEIKEFLDGEGSASEI